MYRKNYQKPKKRLTTDSILGLETRARRAGKLTEKQVHRLFAPAETLGASEDVRLACDAALQDAGIFGLIQHSVNMGQMPLITFMGYAALQQIQQNSLLRTIIQVPVRDMMAPGFELTPVVKDNDYLNDLLDLVAPGEEEAKQAAAIDAINDQWDKLKLNTLMSRALCMAGFEGSGIIFIDTGAQGEELLLPLDISRHSAELAKDRPLKFKLIDPINVFPGTYNSSEPLGDHYFEPQTWWVLGTQVHCSRLIIITPNEVPLLLKPAYNFLGLPQAQLYWDYVIHWNQNRDSINRLLNKFSLLAFKTNMEDVLSGGLSDDLNRRMDFLAEKRSNDGVLLMDKDTEDIINVTTPLAGATDIVKQSLEALAVISHIPAVVLFGQSPSGFNSTGDSDLNNYANLIEARREAEMREPIQKLVDILRYKYTELLDPIKVRFLPFDTSKSAEQAQTDMSKAQTMAALIQSGIISAEEARQKLGNDRDGGWQFISIDDAPEEGGNLPDDFMDEMNGTGEAANFAPGQTQSGDADKAQ